MTTANQKPAAAPFTYSRVYTKYNEEQGEIGILIDAPNGDRFLLKQTFGEDDAAAEAMLTKVKLYLEKGHSPVGSPKWHHWTAAEIAKAVRQAENRAIMEDAWARGLRPLGVAAPRSGTSLWG